MAALSERRDVIIVASVSCIYSLGDPIDYRSMVISLRPGMQMEREHFLKEINGTTYAVRAFFDEEAQENIVEKVQRIVLSKDSAEM